MNCSSPRRARFNLQRKPPPKPGRPSPSVARRRSGAKSGRGLPHSKTLRVHGGPQYFAPAFGLRQPSGALPPHTRSQDRKCFGTSTAFYTCQSASTSNSSGTEIQSVLKWQMDFTIHWRSRAFEPRRRTPRLLAGTGTSPCLTAC